MVVVVGAAVPCDAARGLAVRAFHTAPLAGAYLLWLALAPKGQPAGNYHAQNVAQVWRFVVIGFEAAFARQGQIPFLGFLLGAVLVVGLGFAFRGRGAWFPLGPLAPSIALLGGALLFLVLTGIVRAGQGGLLFLLSSQGPSAARVAIAHSSRRWRCPRLAIGADADRAGGTSSSDRHRAAAYAPGTSTGSCIPRTCNSSRTGRDPRPDRRRARLPGGAAARLGTLVTIENPLRPGRADVRLADRGRRSRVASPIRLINPVVASSWTPSELPRAGAVHERGTSRLPPASVLDPRSRRAIGSRSARRREHQLRAARRAVVPPAGREAVDRAGAGRAARLRIVPASGGVLLCS